MPVDRTHIVVLNHNGRRMLEACLPSVVAAARRAPVPCAVTVLDNASTDTSLDYVRTQWPAVGIERSPNLGLASFNRALEQLDEPVVLLLNNDVRLAPDAVGPLVQAFDDGDDVLFTAPQCWTFDGREYEGMRTRVRSRFGLVQGLCRIPDHEALAGATDLTASAGPVLAVDRRKFLALGGFDTMYFPGRIEDLDLGFRAWMAGWKGLYVPASRAEHQGAASFGPAFGAAGNERLALRNTLLFTWANLAGTRLAQHLAWLPVRVVYALARGRKAFPLALADALSLAREALARRQNRGVGTSQWIRQQEGFFRCFRW